MRHGALTVLTAVLILGTSGGVSAQDVPGRVRGYGAGPGDLIAKAVTRSATFRELAGRLERGDLVVYVEFSRCTGGVPACLLWAAPAAGARRLLARVDHFGRPEEETIALIAHELQHAAEVAAAPDVADEFSFRRLFARTGWKGSEGFETAEAREVTRKVLKELVR
jgi:hypothetical protein